MNPSEGDYEQRTPGPSMAISVFVMDSPGSDFLFTWGGVDVLWWLALKKGDEIKQPAQGCDVVRHVPVEGFFVDAGCGPGQGYSGSGGNQRPMVVRMR